MIIEGYKNFPKAYSVLELQMLPSRTGGFPPSMKRLIVLATALTFLTGTVAFPQAGSQTTTQTEKKEEKKKEEKKKEEKKKEEKKS